MTESILLSPAPQVAARKPAPSIDLSLLSLPAAELSARVRAEVERNVVLVAHEVPEPVEEAVLAEADGELPVEEWMHDLGRPSFRPPADSAQERHEGFLRSLPGRPESLHDSLRRQLLLAEEDPWRRWVGEQLIFSLDDRGYLRGHLCHVLQAVNEDLAARTQVMRSQVEDRERRRALAAAPPTEMPEARIAKALLAATDANAALKVPMVRVIDRIQVREKEAVSILRAVQGLEPTGVGARDLQECLLLQLTERRASPLAKRIVQRCLREVERGSWRAASHKACASISAVRAATKLVLSLDRAPGLSVAGAVEGPPAPDVVAERQNGGWLVRLASSGMPRLSLNRKYARRATESDDVAERRYLVEQVAKAKAILGAIDARERTLLRVCEALVEAHGPGLLRGKGKARPVTVAEVAKRVGLPVAAVEMAIEGKTIATPSGVVALSSLVAAKAAKGRKR